MVTTVPNMSIAPPDSNFSIALFGRTRRAILVQLYGHPDEAYYLRQLVRSAGLGLGAVQREVARLAGAGIIQRTARGRQVYYQANPACRLFAELKSLVVKTAGVVDTVWREGSSQQMRRAALGTPPVVPAPPSSSAVPNGSMKFMGSFST